MNTKQVHEKDAEVKADMHKRIGLAVAETMAIATAIGRWAPSREVAGAVRSLLAAGERLSAVASVVGNLPAEYIARPERMVPQKGWTVDLVGKHAALFAEMHGASHASGEGADMRIPGMTVTAVSGGTGAHGGTVRLFLTHAASSATWGPVAATNVALPGAVKVQPVPELTAEQRKATEARKEARAKALQRMLDMFEAEDRAEQQASAE